MERHGQNFPFQYHNGGIWPFVAGFWVLLLAKLGRKVLAWKELERYAEACRVNDWEFNEWLHGKTGKPLGMPGQSWNAAMFVLAYRNLQDGTGI
jgi:glycogen debranching enzyme